jgi:hypothetical protein
MPVAFSASASVVASSDRPSTRAASTSVDITCRAASAREKLSRSLLMTQLAKRPTPSATIVPKTAAFTFKGSN